MVEQVVPVAGAAHPAAFLDEVAARLGHVALVLRMYAHLVGGVATDGAEGEHELRGIAVGFLPELVVGQQLVAAILAVNDPFGPVGCLLIEGLGVHLLIAADGALLHGDALKGSVSTGGARLGAGKPRYAGCGQGSVVVGPAGADGDLSACGHGGSGLRGIDLGQQSGGATG